MKKLSLSILLTIISVFAFTRMAGAKPFPGDIASSSVYFTNASSDNYDPAYLTKALNQAPVANAGPDQTVNEGNSVLLDGSASSDPDGNALTYHWTAPAGITLSSITDQNPTFTAPQVSVNTSYTLTLVVNDGLTDSPADQVIITVKNVINGIPLANAGPDQSVNEGAAVSLDGSASSDPDGNPLTYHWTAPAGITLSSNTAPNPTFTAPEVIVNTSYTLTLKVNDGVSDSPSDQVVITIKNVINQPPVANAGPDQIVNEGATVSLDGSASYDPEGNALTYHWTVPAGITLSSNTAPNPTFTTPEVIVNTSYTLTLKVNDGLTDSPTDQVIITVKNVINGIPVANAGPDQVVNEGASVSLDGSASSDPEGNALTYHWTAPSGISLSSITDQNPTFTAPQVSVNTSYTLTLKVNDGLTDSPADQVIITVKQVNKAPVANAGPYQSVNEGETATLDGSASSDPDGNPITYKWTSVPGIALSSETVVNPTFTAPEVSADTQYTFSLVVNDGLADSPADVVVVTVFQVNKAPVANAGPDQAVNEGEAVALDGSGSSDPDGNPLTYHWTAPAGILLSSETDQNPTFTAPQVTINTSYTLTLKVNDGLMDSPSDQVVITVKQVNKAPVANAGPYQSVNEGATATLDGSASSDPDGNPITYKWTTVPGITLSSETVVNPTFTAPEVSAETQYTFSLIVSDGLVDSPADKVVVTLKNKSTAPTAATSSADNFCPGASADLSVVGGELGSGASWQWYTGTCGGTAAGAGATIQVSPTETTMYWVRAEGDCNITACAQVTVSVKKTTTITIQPASDEIQYGCDAIVLSVVADGDGLKYQWYKNTTNSNSGGTAIGGANQSSYQTPHNYQVGTYFYYVKVTGTCGSLNSNAAVVKIVPQMASAVGDIYYTGPSMAWTTSPTSNTATVSLSATIKNSDPCGDIRTARITFTLNGQPIPGAQNLPVDFIDPNYPEKGGTASAIVKLNISKTVSSEIFDIGVLITGNYTSGNFVPGDITIIKPKPGGLIAGGTLLCNSNSAGYVKGSGWSNLNFFVEYAMKGKSASNPKGKVSLLVSSYNKPDGTVDNHLHWYSIKSSAIASLNISTLTNSATFSGKSNISEIDLITGKSTPVEGNCMMVLDLKDINLTGKFNFVDLAGITIQRNGGGLWYSNNWVNTKNEMAKICGGDITVTGTRFETDDHKNNEIREIAPIVEKANLLVYPNPFSERLKFEFVSPTDTYARIYLYDITGHLVQTIFDNEVKAGIYNSVDFVPSSMAPGMYLYRMIIGEKVLNGKVLYKK